MKALQCVSVWEAKAQTEPPHGSGSDLVGDMFMSDASSRFPLTELQQNRFPDMNLDHEGSSSDHLGAAMRSGERQSSPPASPSTHAATIHPRGAWAAQQHANLWPASQSPLLINESECRRLWSKSPVFWKIPGLNQT